MIVPMKTISLVVMDKDREESLEKLRETGVVHLEKKNIFSAALTKLLERKARVEASLRVLRPYEKAARAQDKKNKAPAANAGPDAVAPEGAGDDLVSQVLDYANEQKNLQGRLSRLYKERSRLQEWGDFNPRDLSLVAEQTNINLFLYKVPRNDLEILPEDTRFITLGEDKKYFRLLVFDSKLPDRNPVAPGEHSLTEINTLISEVNGKLAGVGRQLSVLVKGKDRLEEELKSLIREIEFETARAGMGVLGDAPRESTVAWITGFVPQEDLGIIKRKAAENGWALIAGDPGPDDRVPTKLKNNRFVRLLYPLTDFLKVVPGYREVDISGWFLLFFTIFFGMIYSDAAYGALFMIIAAIGILKTRKKGTPPGFKLLLLLGSSNFVWGVLTCTWFGVDVQNIPLALQQISLPLISNVTAAKSAQDNGIVTQNIMIFCFSLALLQLSIGHLIAISKNRTLKNLAHIGAIAMLMGMYGIVLSLIASNEYRRIPFFMPCVYLLGGGFLLNCVFVNYEGSIAKSIMGSLKNFISVILGITNVFSDIMSYLRLWAVGLAGAAISSIIDNMAGPLLGHLLFFLLGILLLVFGHGLNLVLNALSVLVHGVRLNTLEFSGRIGLNWAGFAYKPFSDPGIPGSKGRVSQ